MKQDRNGKIQSHLDLRAIQERTAVHSGIHLSGVPEPQPLLRRKKLTLLRLQELLREIMRGSDAVSEAVQAPKQAKAAAPAVVGDEQANVIYVDSTGLASQRNT